MPKEPRKLKPVIHAHSKVRLNVHIKKHIHDGILDIAKEEGWTATDVVRESLKKFIKDYKEGKK